MEIRGGPGKHELIREVLYSTSWPSEKGIYAEKKTYVGTSVSYPLVLLRIARHQAQIYCSTKPKSLPFVATLVEVLVASLSSAAIFFFHVVEGRSFGGRVAHVRTLLYNGRANSLPTPRNYRGSRVPIKVATGLPVSERRLQQELKG